MGVIDILKNFGKMQYTVSSVGYRAFTLDPARIVDTNEPWDPYILAHYSPSPMDNARYFAYCFTVGFSLDKRKRRGASIHVPVNFRPAGDPSSMKLSRIEYYEEQDYEGHTLRRVDVRDTVSSVEDFCYVLIKAGNPRSGLRLLGLKSLKENNTVLVSGTSIDPEDMESYFNGEKIYTSNCVLMKAYAGETYEVQYFNSKTRSNHIMSWVFDDGKLEILRDENAQRLLSKRERQQHETEMTKRRDSCRELLDLLFRQNRSIDEVQKIQLSTPSPIGYVRSPFSVEVESINTLLSLMKLSIPAEVDSTSERARKLYEKYVYAKKQLGDDLWMVADEMDEIWERIKATRG